MTDTSETQLDEQRLELLHRKLAERGLSRSAVPDDGAGYGLEIPALSDGQRRMWFVQSIDPAGSLLNV
ncbi:MAG: hypothetical protein ACRDU4_15960, partial [Mycobacterium sp.]